MNKRVLVNLAVFGSIFVALLVWSIGNVVTVDAIERPYEVTAEFPYASGILPRAEVAYLGVHAGDVKRVERVPEGVVITLQIDRDRRIPAGATASIFRKSAVGEPYIDFFPPEGYTSGGPYLEAGDVVPAERTTNPLEFSELLRSASRLIQGIDPERLKVLVHELALTLDDRGEDLRELTESGDALAQAFAERTDVLDRLATNNTRLTHVLAEHRESVGATITDLADLAESLDNVKDDASVLLDRGAELLSIAADLVGDQKADLDCALRALGNVVEVATTDEAIGDLQRTLEIGPEGYGRVWESRDVIDGDVWVRVGLVADPTPPSQQYVPPIPVPAVPEIPACASSLPPTAQSSTAPRPSTSNPAPRTLAATMGGMASLIGLLAIRLLRGES